MNTPIKISKYFFYFLFFWCLALTTADVFTGIFTEDLVWLSVYLTPTLFVINGFIMITLAIVDGQIKKRKILDSGVAMPAIERVKTSTVVFLTLSIMIIGIFIYFYIFQYDKLVY